MSRHGTIRHLPTHIATANAAGGESEAERIAERLLGGQYRGRLAFGSKEVEQAAERRPVTIRKFSWQRE